MPRNNLIYESQTSGTSCAAKCAQIVMHSYKPEQVPMGSEEEMRILTEGRMPGHPVATHPRLANAAAKRGFDVTYYTKHRELYRFPTDVDDAMPKREFEEKLRFDKLFLQEAKKNGVEHRVIDDPVSAIIEPHLGRDEPVITMTGHTSLHDVILECYVDEGYRVLDPARGFRSVDRDTFHDNMETAYGISSLVIT